MKRIISIILFITLTTIIQYSCEDQLELSNDQACNVDNPLEDLSWLKEMKLTIQLRESLAGAQIIQYTYQGDYVFWVDLCYQPMAIKARFAMKVQLRTTTFRQVWRAIAPPFEA